MEIIEKAPAKINLGLDVLGKRPDGYHELDMIMASVDLSDRITVRQRKDDKIVIHSAHHKVPLTPKNHAYKAAMVLRTAYNIKAGVDIYIEKVIPVAAGLAGGSSDAAATLRALNQLWQLDLSLAQLAKLGEQVGSDVPYCVYGGLARVKGRGEHVQPLAHKLAAWVVLVKPTFGVSTPDIFGQVDLATVLHPEIDLIESALANNDLSEVMQTMGNSLESITSAQHPIIAKIKDRMHKSGADGVLMSGSGPTVFGICQQAQRAKRLFNSMQGFCEEVYLVRIL